MIASACGLSLTKTEYRSSLEIKAGLEAAPVIRSCEKRLFIQRSNLSSGEKSRGGFCFLTEMGCELIRYGEKNL